MSDNSLRYAAFWLVWNPGGRSPYFKHDTEAGAITEAERLARTNPGETFVVVEAVTARRVDSMLRLDFRADSDVPF